MRSLLETDASVEVVAEASDGLEALRLCEEHHPDLLILDVAMPKLNGIDVAARSQKMQPPPRAIMLSMHLDESYMQQLQERGLTDSYDLLTDREKEVMQLLAEGRSNKEVAALLDVGLSTVETHRANLMQKLNLHSTAEIVLYAVRKRLIV